MMILSVWSQHRYSASLMFSVSAHLKGGGRMKEVQENQQVLFDFKQQYWSELELVPGDLSFLRITFMWQIVSEMIWYVTVFRFWGTESYITVIVPSPRMKIKRYKLLSIVLTLRQNTKKINFIVSASFAFHVFPWTGHTWISSSFSPPAESLVDFVNVSLAPQWYHAWSLILGSVLLFEFSLPGISFLSSIKIDCYSSVETSLTNELLPTYWHLCTISECFMKYIADYWGQLAFVSDWRHRSLTRLTLNVLIWANLTQSSFYYECWLSQKSLWILKVKITMVAWVCFCTL